MNDIIGLDVVCQSLLSGKIRSGMVNGVECGSLVDAVALFRPDIKNPRQYWKDHKAQIMAKDSVVSDLDTTDKAVISEANPELVANLYQLQLEAADGKKYKTDVAPDWFLVYVGLTINQDFRIWMAKNSVTPADIRYRMGNFARSRGGFAADAIHLLMNGDISEPETPWESQGYRGKPLLKANNYLLEDE